MNPLGTNKSILLVVGATLISGLIVGAGVCLINSEMNGSGNKKIFNITKQKASADKNQDREISPNDRNNSQKTHNISQSEISNADIELEVTYSEEFGGDVTQEPDTTITVKDKGIVVGHIKGERKEAMYNAEIIKQTKDNVYIGLYPDGIGGYILYLIDALKTYRYSIKDQTLTEMKGSISAISPDETFSAGREFDEKNNTVKIVIRRVVTGALVREFAVPTKYLQAGDLAFSPNSRKIAFSASAGDPDTEMSQVFVGDIASGILEPQEEEREGVAHTSRWKNNSEVLFYLSN